MMLPSVPGFSFGWYGSESLKHIEQCFVYQYVHVYVCVCVCVCVCVFISKLLFVVDSPCHELIAQLKAVYNDVLDRERLHIDAVLVYSQGDLPKACQIWDSITVQYPLGENIYIYIYIYIHVYIYIIYIYIYIIYIYMTRLLQPCRHIVNGL